MIQVLAYTNSLYILGTKLDLHKVSFGDSVVPVRTGLKSLYLTLSEIMPVSLYPGEFGAKDLTEKK